MFLMSPVYDVLTTTGYFGYLCGAYMLSVIGDIHRIKGADSDKMAASDIEELDSNNGMFSLR